MIKAPIFLVTLLVTSLFAELKHITPQALYYTPTQAYNEVKKHSSSVLFVDVRTQLELEYVGWTPLIDLNIPYNLKSVDEYNSKKNRFKYEPNSHFLVAIKEALHVKKLSTQSKIILLCRSGSRSSKAANLLFQAGYSNVYTVTTGFEGNKNAKGKREVDGWKNDNLPWSYNLIEEKMYFEE